MWDRSAYRFIHPTSRGTIGTLYVWYRFPAILLICPGDMQERGVTVLEDSATPTFLSLSATEWHAFGFGLKEGLWFWKRTPLAWDEIKKMEQLPETERPLSPELMEALIQKYHYYIIGFAIPEDCTLLGCGVYLVITNTPALAKIALSFFGYSG